MPPVPLTLEGATVLHQMFRFRRLEWQAAPAAEKLLIAAEASSVLGGWEGRTADGKPQASALFSQVGHKGDLMLVHFRDSVEAVHRTELTFAKLGLARFLEPVNSYLSIVELGLYESSAKAYSQLFERGIEPHSAEWNAAIQETVARQSAAMAPRLWPAIPDTKYLCFYPMDRKRAEQKNWYQVSMAERQRMMHEHGMIGRRYADSVRQIITGSIGLDDWEWGVDLFADDPSVFKKLIYEMRFDEVSAVYALFGAFYIAIRVAAANLSQLLEGELI
jgi:chlorite dismutase